MMNCVQRKFTRAKVKSTLLLKKFKKNTEGVVAIEFGFIAIPFFLLIMGILEISLVFLAEINLADATTNTARKLRTGQDGISTLSEFKKDICDNVVFIPNCTAKLKVDVRTYQKFANINTNVTINSDGSLNDNFLFQAVKPGTIATVRTFIEWELFAQIPMFGLGNLPNNNRLVEAFSAFRAE